MQGTALWKAISSMSFHSSWLLRWSCHNHLWMLGLGVDNGSMQKLNLFIVLKAFGLDAEVGIPDEVCSILCYNMEEKRG